MRGYVFLLLSCPKSVIGHPGPVETMDSRLRTSGMTDKKTDLYTDNNYSMER